MAAMIALLAVTSLQESAWDGFKPGSWARVHIKAAGAKQDRELTLTHTLEKIDGGPVLSQVKVQSGDVEKSEEIRRINGWVPPEGSLESDDEAARIVDGKEIKCRKKKYSWKKDSEGLAGSMTCWISEEARIPYHEIELSGPDIAVAAGTLRVEFEARRGKDEYRVEMDITSLAKEVEVGGKKVMCVVETGFVEQSHGRLTQERWLSGDVPGHEVRLSGKGKLKGDDFEVTRTLEDFHVAP
jgi:hypothetical protein